MGADHECIRTGCAGARRSQYSSYRASQQANNLQAARPGRGNVATWAGAATVPSTSIPYVNVKPCTIKVIGVGGGGGNAVRRMVDVGVPGIDFMIMNTDTQALAQAPPGVAVLPLGLQLTHGLGAGGRPDIGERAAEESLTEIHDAVKGANMVFVTCGMGGGTGSGAASVVARCAKKAGCLTVGVVTRPFKFEGGHRTRNADAAIAKLRPHVDAIIVVENEKLASILPPDMPYVHHHLLRYQTRILPLRSHVHKASTSPSSCFRQGTASTPLAPCLQRVRYPPND